MSVEFQEHGLVFSFDERWTGVKYDAHPLYRKGIQRQPGTKAVDYVGLRGDGQAAILLLMEANDFRATKRLSGQSLREAAAEVAVKMRDTLAGVYCAWLRNDLPAELASAVGASRPPQVLLLWWCEHDLPHGDLRQLQAKLNLMQRANQTRNGVAPLPCEHLFQPDVRQSSAGPRRSPNLISRQTARRRESSKRRRIVTLRAAPGPGRCSSSLRATSSN